MTAAYYRPGHDGELFAGAAPATSLRLLFVRGVCDVQRATAWTSDELYNIMRRECESTGCPDWMAAGAGDADTSAGTASVSVYAFVMDQGPDNQGVTTHISALLCSEPQKMMIVVWCFPPVPPHCERSAAYSGKLFFHRGNLHN